MNTNFDGKTYLSPITPEITCTSIGEQNSKCFHLKDLIFTVTYLEIVNCEILNFL